MNGLTGSIEGSDSIQSFISSLQTHFFNCHWNLLSQILSISGSYDDHVEGVFMSASVLACVCSCLCVRLQNCVNVIIPTCLCEWLVTVYAYPFIFSFFPGRVAVGYIASSWAKVSVLLACGSNSVHLALWTCIVLCGMFYVPYIWYKISLILSSKLLTSNLRNNTSKKWRFQAQGRRCQMCQIVASVDEVSEVPDCGVSWWSVRGARLWRQLMNIVSEVPDCGVSSWSVRGARLWIS